MLLITSRRRLLINLECLSEGLVGQLGEKLGVAEISLRSQALASVVLVARRQSPSTLLRGRSPSA